MPHEYCDVIETVVTNVTEQMAFVFIDPVEASELTDPPAQAVRVTLTFSGAGEGKLTVIADRTIGRELAANLTGADEVSDQEAEQAIKEVVNVIAGQLLTKINGTEPVFDLNPPEIEPLDTATWREQVQDPEVIALLAEGRPLLVHFKMARCPST